MANGGQAHSLPDHNYYHLSSSKSRCVLFVTPSSQQDALFAHHASMSSWARSSPFKFIVGERRKGFWFHTDLVAGISKPLKALVTGPMREARLKCVEWDDIDEDTVGRFAEFVYVGDYRSPESEVGGPPISSSPRVQQLTYLLGLQKVEAGMPGRGRRNATEKRVKDTTTTILQKLRSKLGFSVANFVSLEKDPYENSAFVSSLMMFEVRYRPSRMKLYRDSMVSSMGIPVPSLMDGNGPAESPRNIMDVLFAHARTYVFGDRYYKIARLMKLATAKLFAALYTYASFPEHIDGLADLVRYV